MNDRISNYDRLDFNTTELLMLTHGLITGAGVGQNGPFNATGAAADAETVCEGGWRLV
jgi:hypothetical protein